MRIPIKKLVSFACIHSLVNRRNKNKIFFFRYTNALELPHLPEMVFPSNVLILKHNSGAQIEFSALDALRKVCNRRLPFKVACSEAWQETR